MASPSSSESESTISYDSDSDSSDRTSSDVTDSVVEEGDESATIDVAPFGDLRLLVGTNKRKRDAEGEDAADPCSKTYLVSSLVLCLASPVWRAMFSPQGGFLEANTSDGSREVRFAEDDPSALLLVLRIAHLQFRQIPATLNYKQLLNLALVCDKYDTVELVRPWLPRWEKPLRQFAFEPNQEEWLFIAWTFGDTEIYKELASTMVSDSTTDEVGQCFRSGRLLGNNMPPGAIETILEGRKVKIKALLEMCQKFVELYESDDILCEATAWSSRSGKSVSDDVKRQCDSLNLGCLVKGLKKYRIVLDPLATDDVHGSVRNLTGRLRSLPCFPLDGNDSIHRRCKFTNRIHDWIMCVERDVSPSGMDESHLKHMEEQAKK